MNETRTAVTSPHSLTLLGRHIARTEGVAGLTKGIGPSLLREASYSSIRLSLYEPLRNKILTE